MSFLSFLRNSFEFIATLPSIVLMDLTCFFSPLTTMALSSRWQYAVAVIVGKFDAVAVAAIIEKPEIHFGELLDIHDRFSRETELDNIFDGSVNGSVLAT
mgnify:CR=1 FL=1